MSEVPALSPVELKSELESGANLLLLDVREADELEISSLPGIIHIPLGEIEDRYSEIPKDRDVVVICRTGGRSGRTTEFLLNHGYKRVRNMATGMNGYATTVDQTMKTY